MKENNNKEEDIRLVNSLLDSIRELQQENKELKKQLEAGEEQYTDLVEEKEELKQLYDSTILKKQELIDYLKEQINERKLTGNDEDYIKLDVYEEILSKIEKSDK